jgi:RNA polymerase sigma-70 factor (sigma-E family)
VQSFAQFMEERTPFLLRRAWLLTQHPQDAEDLTQETLLKVHQRWRQVSRSEDVNAYTNRMLVNCHIDAARGRHLDVVALENVAEPSVEDTAGLLVDRDLVDRMLADLPPRQRVIVILRYLDQLDTAEISSLLDIAESTVRSSLARALGLLREIAESHNIGG